MFVAQTKVNMLRFYIPVFVDKKTPISGTMCGKITSLQKYLTSKYAKKYTGNREIKVLYLRVQSN